ncbi:MAG: CoA transferase, partial [Desulfurellaceae bacterium]|nr:CoA transferase [Desulfurellaceae bacterium]
MAETTQHSRLRERGTVRTINDPIVGEFDIPGMPLRFSSFPDDLPLKAPTLGQHNQEILTAYLKR